jgi:hypothetical protein
MRINGLWECSNYNAIHNHPIGRMEWLPSDLQSVVTLENVDALTNVRDCCALCLVSLAMRRPAKFGFFGDRLTDLKANKVVCHQATIPCHCRDHDDEGWDE